MKTIIDLGMFDASDTRYYLEDGYRVVAVEANPALVRRAERELSAYLESGRLDIVNAAVGPNSDPVELTVCGDDLGSSSIFESALETRTPLGKFTVPGITLIELFERFGVPYYLKIDLEGADHFCVRALSKESRPNYLSFEIGTDFESLFRHVAAIGYSRFKLINQCNFREATNQGKLFDRLAMKMVRTLGYAEPMYVRRQGRHFKLGHSSGPAPWVSDGPWVSKAELLVKWEKTNRTKQGNAWYDLHAML